MSIDLKVLEAEIKSHMGDQPYSITCSECGEGLDCANVEVDGDFDLYLKISPCQTCIDSAVEDAKKEMESN